MEGNIICELNSIIDVDGPLESLAELSDGKHFTKLINLISDATAEDKLAEDGDVYGFIVKFISEYFNSQIEDLIAIEACKHRDEFELAKLLMVLLSAVVQHSLNKDDGDILRTLTQLDESVQEDIKDCLKSVILSNDGRLSPEFSDILSEEKDLCVETPKVWETPKRSTAKTATSSPVSPILSLIGSPEFARQTAVRKLESQVMSLRHDLLIEEKKVFQLEIEKNTLNRVIQDNGREIKDLKEKVGELTVHRDSTEEAKWDVIDQYKSEITSLVCQLKDYQELKTEFSKMEEENAELVNLVNNLNSKVEDYEVMKTQSHSLAANLHELQAAVEIQKEVIGEKEMGNINLKGMIVVRDNEIERLKSLYDDAMREVRILQSSPERPRGESMKIIPEMKLAELESEIKILKEGEFQLKEHLKCSTVQNERLKKNVATALSKLHNTEKELTEAMKGIELKDIELLNMHSSVVSLRNEKQSLETQLQTLHQMNEQKLAEEEACHLKEQTVLQELQHLTSKMSENEGKWNSLMKSKEEEFSELHARAAALKEENSYLREQVKTLSGENSRLKEVNQNFDVNVLSSEINLLKKQLFEHEESRKAENSELKSQISDLSEKLQFYCQKTVYSSLPQSQNISDDLKISQARYDELKAEFAEHMASCESSKEAETGRCALDKLAADSVHLQKQLIECKASQGQSSKHAAKRKEVQKVLHDAVQSNKVVISGISMAIDSLKQCTEKKVKNVEKTWSEIRKLESSLKELEASTAKIFNEASHERSTETANLQVSLKKKSSDLELTRNSENAQLKKKIEDIEKLNNDLMRSNKKKDEDLAKLLAEIQVLKYKNKERDEKVKKIQDVLRKLRTEEVALESDDQSQALYYEMPSTSGMTTWKIEGSDPKEQACIHRGKGAIPKKYPSTKKSPDVLGSKVHASPVKRLKKIKETSAIEKDTASVTIYAANVYSSHSASNITQGVVHTVL